MFELNNWSKWKRYASLALIGAGLVLFVLAIIGGTAARLALPLLIIVLGVIFIMMVFILQNSWIGAPWLFLPGGILIPLGLILFLNVATGDWNAWSYAWLLIIAGIGVSIIVISRSFGYRQLVTLIGMGIAAVGITFFALFGMLVGSPFIQIMAPLLLAATGFLLWRLKTDTLLARMKPIQTNQGANPPELLSSREIEVLRLIDQGLTNAVIAERLVVASSTIKTHINNIYSKLGVQTRIQAIRRARELGIL